MFDNIGGKIKYLAQTISIIGIILYIVIGFALMVTEFALVGFIIILIGSLLSWVSSFLLYGFGQLIENSDMLVGNLKSKQNKQPLTPNSAKKDEIDESSFTEEDFIKEFVENPSNEQKDFFSEIKSSSSADLNLILKEQKDLYNEEEIKFIENELKNRNNRVFPH